MNVTWQAFGKKGTDSEELAQKINKRGNSPHSSVVRALFPLHGHGFNLCSPMEDSASCTTKKKSTESFLRV